MRNSEQSLGQDLDLESGPFSVPRDTITRQRGSDPSCHEHDLHMESECVSVAVIENETSDDPGQTGTVAILTPKTPSVDQETPDQAPRSRTPKLIGIILLVVLALGAVVGLVCRGVVEKPMITPATARKVPPAPADPVGLAAPPTPVPACSTPTMEQKPEETPPPTSSNVEMTQPPSSDVSSLELTKASSTGTVNKWIHELGFGFIAPDGGGDDIFVHRKELVGGNGLLVGARVSYDMGIGRTGKPNATNVSGDGVTDWHGSGGYGYGNGGYGSGGYGSGGYGSGGYDWTNNSHG